MSDQPTRPPSLRRRLRSLPRNVVALGVVSFVADFSSEMIYPVFPGFVTRVLGASAAILGLIEGSAEATASITRYPFGRLSDELGRRRPFVLGGYGLAALGKLVLALAFIWPVALGGRVLDRVGKGMRTAPRDALLSPTSATRTGGWRSDCTGRWTPPAPSSGRLRPCSCSSSASRCAGCSRWRSCRARSASP